LQRLRFPAPSRLSGLRSGTKFQKVQDLANRFITNLIDSGQGTLGALVNDRTIYEDIRSILGHIDRGKIARRVFIEASSKDSPQSKQ